MNFSVRDQRDRVYAHLHDSAELKQRVAQECLGAILDAAAVVLGLFARGQLCCAATEEAPPTASRH